MKIQIAIFALALSMPGLALAGIDGSSSNITAAISSGSVDSIIAELERSENIPQRSAYPAVLKLMDHPNERVREAAGWWLGRRGIRQEVISTAAMRLGGSDPIAAANVLDVLRGMKDGPNTIDLVANYAGKPLDEASGIAAFKCLGFIGSASSLPTVAIGITSQYAGVRAEALRTVRVLRAPVGQKVSTTGAAYVGLLNDSDTTVRREAAYTLGFLGQNGLNPDASSSGLNALITTVGSDSSPVVRKAAAWAIGQLGSTAGLAALKAAQNDSDASVRSVARAAAGNIH